MKHALYRFFDAGEALLYVGITCNPAQRWEAHSQDKPWWHEVRRIAIETHDDRDSVLRAEAEAIKTERPRHNVQHNNGRCAPAPLSWAPALSPFAVGDCVAVALTDGQCPVGLIEAMDEEWIRIAVMSFFDGCFGPKAIVIRRAEVSRFMVAALTSREELRAQGWTDWQSLKMFDTEPLGRFQSEWRAAHGDELAQKWLDDEKAGKHRVAHR